MIKTYRILDVSVKMEIENSRNFSMMEKFFSNFELQKDVLHLEIEIGKKHDSCYGIEYFEMKNYGDAKRFFLSSYNKSVFLFSLFDDYSKLFLNSSNYYSEETFLELFLVGFYSFLSIHQTLLMHASAVEYDGNSIVFTAPSGTGKTTQAELWQKYRNATILNGDKVFLKQESDAIHAWGSPWKGSSPYAVNKSAPLAAIVVLQQDSKNSIRKLDIMEAMELFVPHVFFPRWDEKCESAVLDFLDKVMSETDIYLLKCRPDKEAVDITAEAVFRESGMIGE